MNEGGRDIFPSVSQQGTHPGPGAAPAEGQSPAVNDTKSDRGWEKFEFPVGSLKP